MSRVMLTAAEAGDAMRCHEKTVRRMIRAGQLPAVMVAGKWLIDETDLPLTPKTVRPARRREPRGDFARMARQMDGRS